MPNLLKKIIASVTTITCAVWLMGPGMAQAITAAELQVQIDALLAQLATLQSQLSGLDGGSTGTGTVSGCTITSFDRNLSQGMSGDDVKCLQIVLNSDADTKLADSGAGSPGSETTYFGPITKAGAIKFQEKYADEILASWGLTSGTGFVGSTSRTKLNTLLTSGGTGDTGGTGGTGDTGDTGGTTPTGGENKVGLAADNPVAATVAGGSQKVIFAKINFCAASQANTVSKIILARGGVAQDDDLGNIYLYEGTKQVGSAQALNTTNHTATFSSLNWTIPANECKVLTVKADLAAAANAGDSPKLLIQSASKITSAIALDGVFPISSNGMTIAGFAVGSLKVATTTPSGSVVAGSTEQGVAGFKFEASSTEGVAVHSITVTEVGSSVDSDISNLKLFYQSVQLGSTVVSLSNGAATFDISGAPLEMTAGTSKTLTLYADIGSSTGVNDRTIQFEITEKDDVTAYGTNSGGIIVVFSGAWETVNEGWPAKAYAITVGLGTLTVADSTTYSPSAQEYTRGTLQNDIVAFKFSAGANEGVRITKLKIHSATGTALGSSDVSNITLYDAETGEQLTNTDGNTIGAAGLSSSGYVTFGANTTGLDVTGLFDIEKSKNRHILVKADVPTGASTATGFLGFEIDNPLTQVWADGLSSQNDLGTSEINAGASTQVPSTELMHDILEKGTLTVGPNSNSAAASTYAVGTYDYTFGSLDLTSSGEDISVTQLNVFFATGTGDSATNTAADAADVNNIELWDGTTLLQTDSQLSSGYAQFAITLTVPKNTTKTLTVKGDIPSGSDAGALQIWLQKPGDITAEGAKSGVTITPTASSWSAVNGNVMTKGAPGIVITRANTPATQTYVKNTSGAHVATLYFTASTSEDVTITKIRIAGSAATNSSSSAVSGVTAINAAQESVIGLKVESMVGNIKLYNGATQIGSTKPTLTDGTNYDYAEFTGLNLKIAKGTTKAIDVKLDINDATTTAGDEAVYFYFGIASGTSHVAGSGDGSGTALTSTTITIADVGLTGNGMLLGSAGTLTIAADVDTAISAMQRASTEKVNLGSWKFTATNEGIDITKLAFAVTTSTAAVGTSIGRAESADRTTGVLAGGVFGLATSGNFAAVSKDYCFDYSINDAATQTCYFWWGGSEGKGTTTDLLMDILRSASSTNCWASTSLGIAMTGTSSDGAISLSASPAGNYSLEITDCAASAASNSADNLKLGLKYGGTETIGKYEGTDGELGALYLYDGTTLLGTSYLGTDEAGKAIFSFTDAGAINVPKGNKVLTLKADISAYTALTEGSTLYFTLASREALDIVGKGAQSGTALSASTISTSSLAANEMWLYSTKPTITKNAASPSGVATAGTNEEVFRFDVANANSGLDLYINAIRFTLKTNASSSAFDKTYNLYRSTDPSTVIGTGISYAKATTSDTTGYATIYPYAGNQVGSGSTNTYILKANTGDMDEVSAKTEYLIVSIEVDDFYWDDGLAVNANKKVLLEAVNGNKLTW
ncbi:MAG: hypothetical protein ABIG08_02890 [bacterium]